MADMMERAARALCEEDCSSADGQCWVSTPTGERIGFEWELYSHEARAALLAALDPEDESLVSAAESATLNDNPLMLWAYDDALLSTADGEREQGQGEK